MFVLVFLWIYRLPFTIYHLISLIYYLFIVSFLVAIFFSDLKHRIIPDKIILPAIMLSFLFFTINPLSLIINHISSAVLVSLFFYVLIIGSRFFLKREGMGQGDLKLAILMGIFLGFPKILVALYLAFLTGGAAGVILILWGKKKFSGSTIPFGPFLVTGTILSLFYSDFFLTLLKLRNP